MAQGAVLIAIGLAMCMFGTAYAAWLFAWDRSLPRLAWGVVGLGILITAGGIYACIINTVSS